jgi:hypothetical protein
MIYFFADNHYGTHPGKVIYENLQNNKIKFYEDDWSVLEDGSWVEDCELLILNMIGGTCDIPHPNNNAETAVKKYLKTGKPMLLLHGSSAAFWQWSWWRNIPGLRWVRPNDPDNVANSVHPKGICKLTKAKTRHELIDKLQEIELVEDEIYTQLEQVSPVMILMETVVNNKTEPQCIETISPWGGKIVSFIPGHRSENTKLISSNVEIIINYLLTYIS